MHFLNFYHDKFLTYFTDYQQFIPVKILFQQSLIKGVSYISDFNEELINAYYVIRENPEEIISKLKTYKNEKEFYYKIRSQKPRSQIDKAVRFIYLNKTSYNGIYRVNRKGEYNVPFGYRKGENLFDFSNLLNLSKLLKDNVLLKDGDFELIKDNIETNDLIFLDPPYTVAHENNGFIQYNQSIFKWEDQERLAELLKYINSKGAFYILTNASHNSIDNLFNNLGKKHIIQRHSTIGGKGASRNRVNELIFTNF